MEWGNLTNNLFGKNASMGLSISISLSLIGQCMGPRHTLTSLIKVLSKLSHPNVGRDAIRVEKIPPNTTTNTGDILQNTRRKNAKIPSPKSAGPKIALVHTGE
jgi:hypothetical protein